jgi:hypothetical protein
MDMLETIDAYNQELSKRKMLSAFYYKQISMLPGINSEAALKLGVKFSTFMITHQKLGGKFYEREKKIRCIHKLLRNYGVEK